jgi:predicted nucleic acid-binding protein
MKVFFDTSAFAKRYLEEPGTERVIEICDQAEELVLSITCVPEIMTTLNRLVREEKLPRRVYIETRDLILQENREMEICCITGEVVRWP